MSGRRRFGLGAAVLCAVAAMTLIAGAAHAKSWRKLAPDPLASDSSYVAMSERPADSLGALERSWVAVQRDWREQRDEEDRFAITGGRAGSIAANGRRHRAWRTDARFAALASRPYASLTDEERLWLYGESEARRAARESGTDGDSSGMVGLLLLGVIAGVVVGAYMVASAFADGLGNL